jgi:hypothetical protein
MFYLPAWVLRIFGGLLGCPSRLRVAYLGGCGGKPLSESFGRHGGVHGVVGGFTIARNSRVVKEACTCAPLGCGCAQLDEGAGISGQWTAG